MKRKICLALLCALALAAAGCTGTGPDTATPVPTASADGDPVNSTLAAFASGVQSTLDRLDAGTSAAADALGETGLDGAGAEEVLLNLSRAHLATPDAVTFDPDGRIVAAMPEEYRFAVGANIHGEPNVRAALNGTPGLSPRINLVEGFRGVALAHPVLNATGLAGGVSLVIQPERLLALEALGAMGNATLALWAVQTDGTIILDSDSSLIGRTLADETRHGDASALGEVAREILSTPSGYARYRANETAGVEGSIAWDTVGLHGTEWRLVVNREQ
ncbi:MAG: hypothetical protein GXY82_02210 [Methanospirillum sp.]|nr:hypothetical protein [Methanospirillum sp.]